MKKYMILLLASLAFTFVACDNDTRQQALWIM